MFEKTATGAVRTKRDLLYLLMKVLKWDKIGDFGIAGVYVYMSPSGKRVIKVKRW